MGPVEGGVRTTFTEWGILEPTSAWEMMAVNLAQILDGTNRVFTLDKPDEASKWNAKDEKAAVASVNRELRLTLEKVEALHPLRRDEQDEIADRY